MELLLPLNPDDDDIYSTIYKTNLNDRRIIINQDISDDLLETVSLMIIQWNKEDKNIPIDKRKKIYIYLNSDGGDAVMGTMILSSINSSKTPIVTVGFSKCASMACYILAAGHERYCFENTVILYHDGQTGYVSPGNKGKDIQRFYDELDKRMGLFISNKTMMDEDFIETIKDREYYMFPDEAKKLGIIDNIIGIDCELDDLY